MSKTYLKKRLKYILLASACAVTCAATGLVGCTQTEPEPDDEKKTSKEDTQLLKNGNFEFLTEFDDDAKAVYLIDNVENWSHGGTTSSSKSGIIGVSDAAWEALTAESLANKLDYNNALDSNASDYKDLHIDYNGLTSKDLLFADTYEAVNYKEDESGEEDPRKVFIENPETHYGVQKDSNGEYYYLDGSVRQPVYLDEDGNYYFDEGLTEPFSHVLMLHNYNSDHNGIEQYYSSVSVDLPANTAAEVSFWVKTTKLQFSQGADVTQDRGAYAAISHTVGSTSLDDFAITCINTEKLLNSDNSYYDSNITSVSSNGWVQYTVYVNACDFADTTITLKMGLGKDDASVEGYAFFDDVKVTKFVSLDDENCSYSTNSHKITAGDKNATCNLLSDKEDKLFKADYFSRNGGSVTDVRYSKNYFYLLDLASIQDYTPVNMTGFKVGPTVDEDNYTTVKDGEYKGKLLGFESVADLTSSSLKLPKNFNAFSTSSDLLACVKAGFEFTSENTEYSARLNSALTSAANLPKVESSTDNNVLVMLSAYGAAYTASTELSIANEKDNYVIVSFWVKTSDLSGSTAVTIKLTEKDNDDNTQSITLDTTGAATDLDDNKDIYNGWVQCFLYLNNESDTAAKDVKIDISLGNTTIKDTETTAYKAGWAAIANMQTLIADEDTFDYISSGDHTAKLTVGADEEKNEPSAFDEAYGSQSHEIENNIVNPSSYYGVNGASSSIVNNGVISLPYDDINTNSYAGLINKEYFEKGNYNVSDKAHEWYTKLLDSFNASSLDAAAAWNKIFGANSVQPLIIVNHLREEYMRAQSANSSNYKNYFIKNEDGGFERVGEEDEFDENEVYYNTQEVMNYGFIGNVSTASSDSNTVVSVKVKVSEGAVANIYLIEDSNDKEILTFSAPKYTFYYDDDGNVLKDKADNKAPITEQRANVLYYLRDDGLYEDSEGKLFANVHNYKKLYDDENASYFDANGNQISFEDLIDGETYYKDANETQADCYLVTSDGSKIYKFENGKYYYIVESKLTSEVSPFDTSFARYDLEDVKEEFKVTIEGDSDTAENWTTVNFVIHTGNAEKSYRLELWSGARDDYYDDDIQEGAAVIFDYSYLTVSDEKFSQYYESKIIEAYQNILERHNLLKDELLDTSNENIKYYEDLINGYIESKDLPESVLAEEEILENYKSHYYTYTLYDSANYKPFNLDIAGEDETGYDYKYSDFEEKLAYLYVNDDDNINVFVDYSAFDQNITLDTSDTDDGDTDEEENDDETSVWLLISSIILVVVLLFAMLSLYVRHLIKKYHRKSAFSKNTYNTAKANRYIRKLHIKKDVYEEVENPLDTAESSEETSENVDDTAEEVTEVSETVEDTPASSEDGSGDDNGEN